ncbi:MAG: hypothetical protein DI604_24565 [Delftia acidovorans]|nr:MAG: hypothetical protein DI604_24565 [Delftia acidovorans]
MFKASDTINRMVACAGVTTDSALARCLGIPKQTISAWRTRESIPLAVVVDFAINKRISLDFLLLGRMGDTELRPLSGEEVQMIAGPLSRELIDQISRRLLGLQP